MPDFLLLVLEFLKTGIFAVGGGYATLPYLHDMAVRYDWFTLNDLSNFIAISEVTPGPVGINMATFAGYLTGGVCGGVAASLALVTLPTALILLLNHFIPDITHHPRMKQVFYGLIPCACGLILAATVSLLKNALFNFGDAVTAACGWALFALLVFLAFRFKLSPLLLLLIGGVCGLLLL
ncbi:MAG: chromate transporter [Bacillota bacterium]|jgi:chromate transporter